jgi:hypothetical protein
MNPQTTDGVRPFGELTGLFHDIFLEEPVFRGFVESEVERARPFWPQAESALSPSVFKDHPRAGPQVDHIEEVAGPFRPSSGTLEEVVYVEPYSSFFSSYPPHQVLNAVCAWLASVSADFDAQPHSSKIDAVARAGVALCSFCFCAYRTQGTVVFELQRKQGCVVFFYSLWTQLVAALGNLVHEPCLSQTLPFALNHGGTGFGELPPPLTLGAPSILALNTSVASSLLAMLDSPHLETQIEAVRALASAVEGDATNVRILCETFAQPSAPLVQKLADALVHDELARDAAVLLGAIFAHQQTSNLACSTILSSLRMLLSAPTTIYNRDTKRQVLSLVSVLATKLPKQDISEALEPVLASKDICLRNIAHQVLVVVEV